MASTACSSGRPTFGLVRPHRQLGPSGGAGGVQDAAQRIKKTGKAAGILTPNEEEAKKFISWGYTFVAVGADLGLLSKNADALAKRFKTA